jgi:hypothetical protein
MEMNKMISLNHIHVSSPLSFRNLAVSPLLTSQAPAADYFTLDEALSTGKARITELSNNGSVPELQLLNETDRPILLVDGEELIGAKQNRICNLTILAPPRAETIIPVSCVEAGRWYWRSRVFSSSENIFFAEGRARKARDVSESLEKFSAPRAKQDSVWSDVCGKLNRLDARSSTAAMSDAFARFKNDVDRFVDALQFPPQAVGAVFSLNGSPVSLELFESPALCTKLSQKLIRSWALDAIEWGDEPGAFPIPTERQVANFIGTITAAPSKRFNVAGLGEAIRFLGNEVSGGALALGNRVVHVSAFSLAFVVSREVERAAATRR